MRGLNVWAVLCVLGLAASGALAHDESVTDSLALGDVGSLEHEDDAPYAGWIDLTVTNNGTEDWGDFHFEIFQVGAEDPVNVDFLSSPAPVSSQTGLTWAISPDGSAIDLYFYSDPVAPGETANFQVYDVNPDELSFFGVSYWPTPVPEPMSVSLLACGGLALLRRRR